MLKPESNGFCSAENNRARACETCRSTPCTVYCFADSAYLCTSCDVQVHSANRVASRHKRVQVCESCEREPATFLCEADDASLCSACDSEVHSANPLARRHQRVPVLPISGNSYKSKATHHQSETTKTDQENKLVFDQESGEKADEDARDVAYWLFPNSGKISSNHSNNNQNNGLLFSDEYLDVEDYNSSMDYKKFTGQYNQQQQDCSVPQTSYRGDYWLFPNSGKISGNHSNNNQNNGLLFSDEYLDVEDYNSSMDYKKFTGQYNQQQQDCSVPQTSLGGDRVVPHQLEDASGHLRYNQQKFQSNITYGSSGSHHSHNGSLHHNAHISSLETGVVPDSTALDTTASHQRMHKGMIDQLPDPPNQMITQLSPLEREARVLRYKEKRKTRKFEKTIRYASRKAYAERRPRVNGRFAKRREFEAEDQGFNTMPIYDTGHGIVPSF